MTGDVIALDPARLAHLESYLDTFARGCHNRAARIEEDLAGTGHSAPDAVALLGRVARWAADEHLDVAWRRAAVEAMDGDLPLTTLDLDAEMTPEQIEAEAAAASRRLERALAEEPPRWDRVRGLLAEVDRRLGSALYAAALLRYLGPAVARDLALRIETSRRAHGEGAGPVGLDEVAAYVAAQETASRLVRVGAEVPAEEGGVDEEWLRSFMGLPPEGEGGVPEATEPFAGLDPDEVSRVVDQLGYGARLGGWAARALEAGRATPILGAAGAVLGLVTTAIDVADGFAEDPLCSLGQLGLGLAAAGTGVAAAVLGAEFPANLALGGFSALAGQASRWVGEQCATDGDDPPPTGGPPGASDRVDPGTGTPVYPGGGADQPHQDGAGGVLPPNMTRGGPSSEPG